MGSQTSNAHNLENSKRSSKTRLLLLKPILMGLWKHVQRFRQYMMDLLDKRMSLVCARPPNKIGEYAELGDITRDIAKANEVEFLKQCEMRKNENGGKLKVVDINKKPSEIEVKELKSLSQVIDGLKEKFPGLVH